MAKRNLNYLIKLLPVTNLHLWKQDGATEYYILTKSETDDLFVSMKEDYSITTNYAGHVLYKFDNEGLPFAEGISIFALFI